MIHGEVLQGLEELIPITGHIQISSVPGRHEPTTGQVDDRLVLKRIEALGYKGAIGCEYAPTRSTLESLDWMKTL